MPMKLISRHLTENVDADHHECHIKLNANFIVLIYKSLISDVTTD